MADLVPIEAFLSYLDVPSPDATLAEVILDAVEARFEEDSGRADIPFQDAEAGRIEVHDGNGRGELFLAYPVAALTSVKLGYDPAHPFEVLDLTNPCVVVYGTGSRRLARTDGGWFGRIGQPRYVQVVYDAAADLPDSAAEAIKEMAAAIYVGRGSEGVRVERIGGYSVEMASLADTLPSWRTALAAHGAAVL